jgi:acetyl esterase/lipase
MADSSRTDIVHVDARDLIHPAHLSRAAKASLDLQKPGPPYPDPSDKAAWKTLIDSTNGFLKKLAGAGTSAAPLTIEEKQVAGVTVYVVAPQDLPKDDRNIILEMHGGALVYGGGETCMIMAQRTATRLRRRVWTIDYRMPPDHPYPAGLDDCVTVYKELLKERSPSEIIFSGNSAGGNLVSALTLRARDEGLPLPAATILGTPEVDLTESGDSFQTNVGVDSLLRPLMPINLMYANAVDLKHPYVSPLFGDLKNFPPTILTAGTRDLFLSNTVRFHRALRKAGVEAHLHVLEAAGHIGLPGSPEGEELDEEVRLFVAKFWVEGNKSIAHL